MALDFWVAFNRLGVEGFSSRYEFTQRELSQYVRVFGAISKAIPGIASREVRLALQKSGCDLAELVFAAPMAVAFIELTDRPASRKVLKGCEYDIKVKYLASVAQRIAKFTSATIYLCSERGGCQAEKGTASRVVAFSRRANDTKEYFLFFSANDFGKMAHQPLFDIARELGHVFYSHKFTTAKESRIEDEMLKANLFAAKLLARVEGIGRAGKKNGLSLKRILDEVELTAPERTQLTAKLEGTLKNSIIRSIKDYNRNGKVKEQADKDLEASLARLSSRLT